MKTAKGHLTYCSNIHAGEDWQGHFSALQQFFPSIKQQVSPDQPMGIGLRLSHIASMELSKQTHLQAFKTWLDDQQAYVFTMNGFPYGGFHHIKVKDQVHAPDWTTDERTEYSIRLFNILKALLPAGMDGGVSTSPLSYRYWFTSETLNQAKEKATLNILKVAEHLISIRQSTSQILHLDIEPEPDGILETGEEFIEWYESYLILHGCKQIADKFSVSTLEAESLLKDHIRLCYDICHFAIGFEPHQQVIDKLEQKGIKIGKFQISAALKADLPGYPDERRDLKEAFSEFNESTYLHQVVARQKNGALLRYRDLPEALKDIEQPNVQEWRAHFHVPVFAQYPGMIQSTQSDIIEVLNIHKKHLLTQHLEVETYTWEVLPEDLKLPLKESIIREMEWVKDQLS